MAHDWWPPGLPPNVTVGEGSWLYSSYAFVHCPEGGGWRVDIGARTGVYLGTMFDLGPDARVRIGRFGTVVAPYISTNGAVTIGDHALISMDVVISDVSAPAPHGARTGRPPSPPIVIGDNCWLGVRAVVLGGAHLGDGVIVGAGAVVDFEVPDFAVVAGNPARVVGEAGPGAG